ncbi:MAG: FAD-dependent oxidoreductase [Pelagibacteraceae bacterium TMED267]|nr:MAG: FAD-dependent oxidoreductase [Pelagibacteraceae bacterium TMED267]
MFSCDDSSEFDVVIVGGGAGGTSAAIQSARNGAKTLLIEETDWLGGMLTSAGVSAIDGNYKLPSGFWGEFKDSLVSHYGSLEALKTGWVSNVLFEPKVGNEILKSITQNEKNLKILYSTSTQSVSKHDGNNFNYQIKTSEGTFISKILIDGTELGDLLPMLDDDYDVGMDSNEMYDENIAPEIKNDIIQDLTFVMILKNYNKKVKIDKPEGYDASEFYCSTSHKDCPKSDKALWSPQQMMNYGKLPNDKIMINWPIYGNDYYSNLVEMSKEEREVVFEKAKNKSLRYLYYIQDELGFDNYSISDDEYETDDNFPMIPYYREARRMKGQVTFSLNYIKNLYDQKHKLYRTGVLVGDYPVDHHHDAHPEKEKLPKLAFYPIPSYSLPFGSLISKKNSNFLVAEKSISVSNLVNGTTRLQPVVLQIGQIAGLIASESIKNNISTNEIDIRYIQTKILNNGGYIQPYLDVEKNHPFFKAYQRIGSTGILRATGLNIGWSNQTWFYPERNIVLDQLLKDLGNYYDLNKNPLSDLRTKTIFKWISLVQNQEIKNQQKIWNALGLSNFNSDRKINRGEFAIILDYFLNPFNNFKVDIKGNIIKNEY